MAEIKRADGDDHCHSDPGGSQATRVVDVEACRARQNTFAILRRAEGVEGEPPLTGYQHALIRNALQVAGIEFTNDDGPGVQLKAKP